MARGIDLEIDQINEVLKEELKNVVAENEKRKEKRKEEKNMERKRSKMLENLGFKLWERFEKIAEQNDFDFFVSRWDEPGRNTISFKRDDKFAPIITFHLWYKKGLPISNFVSIGVKDRNGNDILTGNNIEHIKLIVEEKDTAKEIEEKFEKMAFEIFEKYGKYSKFNKFTKAKLSSGVFDKNEKELKEGDKVRYFDAIGEVVFKMGAFGVLLSLEDDFMEIEDEMPQDSDFSEDDENDEDIFEWVAKYPDEYEDFLESEEDYEFITFWEISCQNNDSDSNILYQLEIIS